MRTSGAGSMAETDDFSVTMGTVRFDVEVRSDLETVASGAWPVGAIPESMFLTRSWLESQHKWNTMDCRYIVIRDSRNGSTVAVLPCYIARDPEQVRFDNAPRVLLNLQHPRDLAACLGPNSAAELTAKRDALSASGALGYPALVATSANGYLFGYASETAHLASDIVEDCVVRAFDEFADRGAFVTRAVWYVREIDCPTLGPRLKARGYSGALVNAECHMDVAWATFEEYLASLSPGRRGAVRREIRRFEMSGAAVTLHDASAITDEVVALYAGLQSRYGQAIDPGVVLDGFMRTRTVMGDRMKVFLAHVGETLLGFVVAFEYGNVLHCRQAGFKDVGGNTTQFTYFNTVYYAVIRYAIASGIPRIEYGTESYDAKEARGCRSSKLAVYVRSTKANAAELTDYFELYSRAVESYLVAHGYSGSALEASAP